MNAKSHKSWHFKHHQTTIGTQILHAIGPKGEERFLLKPVHNTICVGTDGARLKTLSFLEDIETCIGQHPEHWKFTLDFSEIEMMTAAASVMLFAEITRWELINGYDDVVTIILPQKGSMAAKAFGQTGFYRAVKHGGERKLNNLWESRNVYLSGVDPDKTLPHLMSVINHRFMQKMKFDPTKMWQQLKFYVGVHEAMLNVHQHAYSNHAEPPEGMGKRWWQCAYYDHRDGFFKFIIYDFGQGIAASLNKSMTNMTHNDGVAIEHAMEIGTTCTNDPERGKGSGNILYPVRHKDTAKLNVFSNKGMYTYTKADGVSTQVSPVSFRGTLIEWHFCML